MRVGVIGFLHESNTFVPNSTTYEDFASTSLTQGEAMAERWAGAAHELGGMLTCEGAVPLFATFAVPSGTIDAAAFDRIAGEILESIRNTGPLDGLLMALHGATVARNAPDADGELLQRVREVVGHSMPIVMTFDLHANLSQRMIQHSTAAIGYRSNPHLDQRERGMDAARLMERILRGEVRPVQALETPPLVISNSRQYTAVAPALGLYEDLRQALTREGILSASVAMGFPHADVEEMGVSFLAVADGDEKLARSTAQRMARRAWDRRNEFAGRLTSVEEAVRRVALADELPVALMDVGDNTGGGTAANSTVLLREMRRQGVGNGLIVLFAPEAVAECVRVGVRDQVRLRAGNPELEIEGCVRVLADGRFEETQVRHGGWTKGDQGITAVVETPDGHTVVLTSRRMAPFSLEQILSLGIHPERKRALIVKGVIAPRAAYEVVAKEFILVDTPGESADDPRTLHYKRRRRPLYPLEDDAVY